MKQSVKIIVRAYDKKTGGKFVKLSIGGKYLPLATAEDDVQYQVKFTSKSKRHKLGMLCNQPRCKLHLGLEHRGSCER